MSKKKILIIPPCTDYNRGDQALVLETRRAIEKAYGQSDVYMMSTGETAQCEAMGLMKFSDILKHPSRFDRENTSGISYGPLLKIRWGVIAGFDFLNSLFILNKFTRPLARFFMSRDSKEALDLYGESDSVFVKGGGFLHDYTKGLVGLYSIYYQTYHIRLAIAMGKKVYIMPNSFGPFKNKRSAKMVNAILDGCVFVSARESVSADGVYNGLDRDIPLYPDFGFFLENDKDNKKWAKDYLLNSGIDIEKERIVAITVRPYRFYSYDNPEQKYLEYKKSFVLLVNDLIKKGYKPMLVVHTRAENDHENDERCVNEIYAMLSEKTKKVTALINDNDLNCYDLKAIYGHCSYVVGTRFHSVIFAIEQGVPCLAVTYGGNKGEGIMKDMDLFDYAIDIADTSGDILQRKFNMLEKDNAVVSIKIKSYMEYANGRYADLIREIS